MIYRNKLEIILSLKMFLFRSYNSESESKLEKKITEETVKENYTEDKDYIIQSKYVIILDGEPMSFTDSRDQAMDRVDNMIKDLKFNLILDSNQVYCKWDYDQDVCTISVKPCNSIMAYEQVKHILRWKKITNNY